MLENQPTAAATPRQDPFRWTRADIASALDGLGDPDHPSERAYAQQQGIPHATFHYWTHHYRADPADPIDSFFRSGCGELVLRRILAAVFVVFQQRGACGIRLVAAFLQLAQLDRFVACSRGALAPLAAHLESDLVAFRDQEQPVLTQQMKPKTITLVPDEHFHAGKPCLVGLEPVTGFILVECYRDRRDADTWQEAIEQGIRGMPLQIVQVTSDEASALICLAQNGLEVAHSPDLFHGQHNALKPLLLPLNRPIQQAQKELEKATQRCAALDMAQQQQQPQQQFDDAQIEAVRQEMVIAEQLQQARQRKEEAVQQVRGVGDDYHPFDRQTGKPVTAEEVGQRLTAHVDKLADVVTEADLPEKAKAAVDKLRMWVGKLMGCVAWFWCLANARLEELELSEEVEQVVKEKLLAGSYWGMAAGRARTAEERKRLTQLADELKKEAWQEGGPLSALPEQQRKEVEEVASETAGLFQRSSSSVEGRNGRLSLQHHGHSRVSEQRLKALSVIHNYMVKRPDGTTAAERFFGQKHQDVFSWLVGRMPDLPRPAAKRTKKADPLSVPPG